MKYWDVEWDRNIKWKKRKLRDWTNNGTTNQGKKKEREKKAKKLNKQ